MCCTFHYLGGGQVLKYPRTQAELSRAPWGTPPSGWQWHIEDHSLSVTLWLGFFTHFHLWSLSGCEFLYLNPVHTQPKKGYLWNDTYPYFIFFLYFYGLLFLSVLNSDFDSKIDFIIPNRSLPIIWKPSPTLIFNLYKKCYVYYISHCIDSFQIEQSENHINVR
jgi:hypothetical protein